MLCVLKVAVPKLELVSLVTTKTTAPVVIPESGLVQEGGMMTPTRVETKLNGSQIMDTDTSKSWDIFWYTDKGKWKYLDAEDNAKSKKLPCFSVTGSVAKEMLVMYQTSLQS